MATPEEQAAADEERIRALAEGAAGDAPPEPGSEPEETDPPEDSEPGEGDPPADEEAAAASGDAPPEPGEGDPPADRENEPPPAPRGGRTLERRISTLAAQKRALEQELERVRAAQTASPAEEGEHAEPPQRRAFSSQQDFDEAVRAEAARQSAAREFNNRCNAVEDAGAAIDPTRWATAKRTLGLLDDNGVIPMALLEPALETDKPELVLLALGEDPDRASELLAMSPTKRAMEIAKMSSGPQRKTPNPPPRSAAPPPVEPIGRRATTPASTGPTDRDSDDDWLRKRNEQLAARRRAERAAQA